MVEFRKNTSRGFESTRDFDRPVTGLSRWLKPLRHGRGCGLKGVRYKAVCARTAGRCVDRILSVRVCVGAEAAFWRQSEVWCKETGSAGFEHSREDQKSGALTTTLEGNKVRGWSAGGGQRFPVLGQRRVCEFWQYTLWGRKPRFGVKTRYGAKKKRALRDSNLAGRITSPVP